MGTQAKKVFIVHASEDIGLVKKYIINPLEHELDVKCVYDVRDFKAGREIITSVNEAVAECYKTFVILTPNSVEKHWVKYETLLALEKSQKQGRLCVVIILLNVSMSQVKEQLFGVLSDAMIITVDVNRDNFEKKLKLDMEMKLYEKASISFVQLVASLSVGQVWSHFTGYTKIVLPVLVKSIQSCDWYKQNSSRFPLVEFNLIPYSASVPRKLSDLDDRIKYLGNLDQIIAERGSFKDRPYDVPVYSITDDADGQIYYFVGQVPNTLGILKKLESDPAWHDKDTCKTPKKGEARPDLKISSGERNLQVTRYFFTLNRLVNHPSNKHCNNRNRVIFYDDHKSKAGDELLTAIKEELKEKQKSRLIQQELDREIGFQSLDIDGNLEDFEKTVFIDYDDTCNQDINTMLELSTYLVNNGFQIWAGSTIGKSHCQILEEAMNESRWAVFILSREAIRSENFSLLTFKCRSVVRDSVDRNQVRVIPLLDGLTEDDISEDLRAVLYLSKQEQDYKGKLLQALKLGDIPMESIVSAKNVNQGLAWAYVLNYLIPTIPENIKKLEKLKSSYPDCTVCQKLFIIVPSSCATISMGSLDLDKNKKLINTRFKQIDDVQFTIIATGGVPGRKYQLITYRLKTDTKEYIVAVEYPNAVKCLQEMSELELLSGLSQEHIHDEAWKFKQLAQNIIDHSVIAGQAKLMYYDDTKVNVVDAMLQVIEEEEEELANGAL